MKINEEHQLLTYQLEELDSYLSQDNNSLTPDEVLYFLEQRKSLLESLNCVASFYQAVAIQEELITVSQQEASDALLAASFAETAVEVSAVRSRSNSLSSTCSSISNLAIEVSDIPPPIIPLGRSSSGQGLLLRSQLFHHPIEQSFSFRKRRRRYQSARGRRMSVWPASRRQIRVTYCQPPATTSTARNASESC
jgi:hypothetical protein